MVRPAPRSCRAGAVACELRFGAGINTCCYGTSLTADGLWQPQLQQRLTQCLHRPVRVLNFGKGGTASSWGKENVQSVIAARPDVGLIEFAINDAYKPYAISLEQSYDNTRAIVHEIRGHWRTPRSFYGRPTPRRKPPVPT